MTSFLKKFITLDDGYMEIIWCIQQQSKSLNL